MGLPTSQSTSGINPNLVFQPIQPAATPSALALLDEAYQRGILSADEIRKKLTIQPLQDAVTNAQAKDKLSELQISPVKRAQELNAADQQSKLRDLQIQSGTQEVANAPSVADQQRRLNDARITAADQQNSFNPLKNETDIDAANARTEAQRIQNQTLGAKEQANLEDMQAQAKLRQSQASLADRKNVPGVAGSYGSQVNNDIINKVDGLIAKTKTFSPGVIAGMGRAASAKLPATEMRDFDANLASLKNEISLSQMQEMRDAAQTGTAGMRVTSTKELTMLGDALAGLDPNMSPEALATNLQKVKDSLSRWEAAKNAGGATAQSPNGTANPAPDSVPSVTSQQDYDALPPGAQYHFPGDPAGKLRTKAGQPSAAAAPALNLSTQLPATAQLPAFQPLQPASRNVVNRLQ